MQATRFAAAGVALYGAAQIAQTSAPEPLGTICLVAGAAAFFFLPRRIARAFNAQTKTDDKDPS